MRDKIDFVYSNFMKFILTYDFYNSGRHQIELKAIKDGKQATYSSELVIAAPEFCTVKINTTEGAMLFELFEDTPLHLANFINLVEKDFYKNLIFHRVISGFMIQAGEKSKEYKSIDSDHLAQIPQEINAQQLHYKGALAAARMPDNINPEKSSSGLQFYIVQGRPVNEEQLADYEASRLENFTEDQKKKYLNLGGAPQLDGEYTDFGNMLSGFEVLNKIASANTDKQDRPHEEIRILNIEILN